jgi:hypothetical protein
LSNAYTVNSSTTVTVACELDFRDAAVLVDAGDRAAVDVPGRQEKWIESHNRTFCTKEI